MVTLSLVAAALLLWPYATAASGWEQSFSYQGTSESDVTTSGRN
jgi:hypothetical protein